MNIDLTEQEIEKVLKSYKNKKEREKIRYENNKSDPEFIAKNRARAKNHYENNKDKYKLKYENNKDLMKARNSYYYYKGKNQLDKMKEKFPERVELLIFTGYFKEWNPSASTNTE